MRAGSPALFDLNKIVVTCERLVFVGTPIYHAQRIYLATRIEHLSEILEGDEAAKSLASPLIFVPGKGGEESAQIFIVETNPIIRNYNLPVGARKFNFDAPLLLDGITPSFLDGVE